MPENNVNWQDMGWSGQAAGSTGLNDLLGQFFADPGAQRKYFEDYDTSKEQTATQQMQLGQQSAQEQARASLWKQFQQGRQTPGGFGGGQRNMQTSMGGIFKGLEQGRDKAELGLQSDINKYRSDYRSDVMSQIGELFAGGAEGTVVCDEGEHMAADGSCVADYSGPTPLNCAEDENEVNGECVPDPCYNVTCQTGTHCEGGTCVSDENPNWDNPVPPNPSNFTAQQCLDMGLQPDWVNGGCI